MCGGSLLEVSGSISGTLDDGIFSVTGGSLYIGSESTGFMNYAVLPGGSLGGSFAPAWSLEIEHFGLFTFEDLGPSDTSHPNSFNIDNFVLWGQNQVAYGLECYTDENEYCEGYSSSYGIDLYGVRRVPEPAPLALLGIGLLGMGLTRRRKGSLVAASV